MRIIFRKCNYVYNFCISLFFYNSLYYCIVFYGAKMKYDESDNLVIRASRSVTDRVGDMFGRCGYFPISPLPLVPSIILPSNLFYVSLYFSLFLILHLQRVWELNLICLKHWPRYTKLTQNLTRNYL